MSVRVCFPALWLRFRSDRNAFPFATLAYRYAHEARAYGVMLARCGISLVCWQVATEDRRRTMALLALTLSLAFAISNHYYSVLLPIPLALGEIVRSYNRRRLDLPVWIALATGYFSLVLLLPFIRSARTYSSTFSSNVRTATLGRCYEELLVPGLLPLVCVVFLLAIWPKTKRRDDVTGQGLTSPPGHEIAAAIGLMALPIFGLVLAKLVTNAYGPKYFIAAVLGFSILVAVRFFFCDPEKRLEQVPFPRLNGDKSLPVVIQDLSLIWRLSIMRLPIWRLAWFI